MYTLCVSVDIYLEISYKPLINKQSFKMIRLKIKSS